jgi:hypothetical protein
MDQPTISKLTFYSLGLVAANKDLKSHVIEVSPVEDFPMLNGEVTDNIEKYKTSTQDSQGSVKNIEVNTTASVKATWLPINNSNRKTSPDVRRGETVVLYKFGDSDKYWWNTLFDDGKLRRLETVVYAFSNNSKENVEDTAESTYYLEVSTHRKLMHIHTSKNDGEPFAYDVQIDAKNGVITITDDADNFIVLNSKDRRLILHNADGSILDVNKKVIDMFAIDKINLKSNQVNVNAESINVTGGNVIVTGSAITVSSPNTNIN